MGSLASDGVVLMTSHVKFEAPAKTPAINTSIFLIMLHLVLLARQKWRRTHGDRNTRNEANQTNTFLLL